MTWVVASSVLVKWKWGHKKIIQTFLSVRLSSCLDLEFKMASPWNKRHQSHNTLLFCTIKWQPVLKSYGTDNQWNHAVLTAEDQFLMAANAMRSCVLCLNYSAIDLSRNIVPSSLPSYHTYSLATYSPAILASISSLRALLDFIHLEHY